jgi:hypothetical protein
VPTTRTRRARAPSPDTITPEVLEAWQGADVKALHRLLGLMPCEPGPLPAARFAYGCHQGPPPRNARPFWRAGWKRAQQLQRALYAVAGEPGRGSRHD